MIDVALRVLVPQSDVDHGDRRVLLRSPAETDREGGC
jgi:hypothetical protein